MPWTEAVNGVKITEGHVVLHDCVVTATPRKNNKPACHYQRHICSSTLLVDVNITSLTSTTHETGVGVTTLRNPIYMLHDCTLLTCIEHRALS